MLDAQGGRQPEPVELPEELLPSSHGGSLLSVELKTEGEYRFTTIETNLQFINLIQSGQEAIDAGISPEQISEGSSGSYLVKDILGHRLGVFKPKDEEPYGRMNPKWIKWLHRTCCPCMFGRAILIPNIGYLSEAAASEVDAFLGLGVVPRTQVASMSAKTFRYPFWDSWQARKMQKSDREVRYPPKFGSFQLFVEGFDKSTTVLAALDRLRPLSPDISQAFQDEFERMVVLDYLIRNTDRTFDNWMISVDWDRVIPEHSHRHVSTGILESLNPFRSQIRWPQKMRTFEELPNSGLLVEPSRPLVKIACIDNGLAFPTRHPDKWRSYPYSWASLPESRIPFSKGLRDQLLPLLRDPQKCNLMVARLRQIFEIDGGFDERHFLRQMSVLRGQWNTLVQSLENLDSPAEMIERQPVMVEEALPTKVGPECMAKPVPRHPLFSCC